MDVDAQETARDLRETAAELCEEAPCAPQAIENNRLAAVGVDADETELALREAVVQGRALRVPDGEAGAVERARAEDTPECQTGINEDLTVVKSGIHEAQAVNRGDVGEAVGGSPVE